MTTHIAPGNSIPLSVLLFDQATDKFVRARVVNEDGADIPGSPIAVSHDVDGLYQNDDLIMPDTESVVAIFTVYNDAAFTTRSPIHLPASEKFLRGEDNEIMDAIRRATASQPITVQTDQDQVVPVIVDQKTIPVLVD